MRLWHIPMLRTSYLRWGSSSKYRYLIRWSSIHSYAIYSSCVTPSTLGWHSFWWTDTRVTNTFVWLTSGCSSGYKVKVVTVLWYTVGRKRYAVNPMHSTELTDQHATACPDTKKTCNCISNCATAYQEKAIHNDIMSTAYYTLW